MMLIKGGKLLSEHTIAIATAAYAPSTYSALKIEQVEITMQGGTPYFFATNNKVLSSILMHDVTFKGAFLLSNIQPTTKVNLSKVTIDPDFVGATPSQEAKINYGTEARPLSEIVEAGVRVKGEGGNPYSADTDWNTVKAVKDATEDYQKKIVISEAPVARYEAIFYLDPVGLNLEVKKDGVVIPAIGDTPAKKIYELKD